ncbi:MAG: tetratricopeptide repeat protein [Polyangiales bacterium]
MKPVRGAVVVSSCVVAFAATTVLSGCNHDAVEAQKLAKHAQTIQGEDPKGAIDEFKQASALDPQNHQILKALGTLYEKQKTWAEAADTWHKAAGIDDTFAEYHFRRGHALFEVARKDAAHAGYDKVIEPMNKALKADKNYSDAYWYIGQANYETDDEQAALEAYTSAIKTNPTHLEYYVMLANLYLDLGYADEGLKVATEGQKFKDKTKAKGDNEEAEVALNLYNLILDEARAYELLGKGDEKIKALEKAREVKNPKNTARESEYQLALAYAGKEKFQDACQAITTYLKSPAGKSSDATENRADAAVKKQVWKCP